MACVPSHFNPSCLPIMQHAHEGPTHGQARGWKRTCGGSQHPGCSARYAANPHPYTSPHLAFPSSTCPHLASGDVFSGMRNVCAHTGCWQLYCVRLRYVRPSYVMRAYGSQPPAQSEPARLRASSSCRGRGGAGREGAGCRQGGRARCGIGLGAGRAAHLPLGCRMGVTKDCALLLSLCPAVLHHPRLNPPT